MLIELGCLAGGIIPGRLMRKSRLAHKVTGRVMFCSIYALLFILGAKLGGDEVLFKALLELGLIGLLLGFCCTMGSAICVRPAQRYFKNWSTADPAAHPGETENKRGGLWRGMRGSLTIFGFFCLGLALGALDALPVWLYAGNASMYFLWVMLFFVGMSTGFDLGALLLVREVGLRLLLVPLLTMVGCALGAILAGFFLPDLSLRSLLTVGAGFGYYSLSSVIITEMGNPALGSISFLANMFRELFSLLAAPLLARLFGPLAPIGAAAAPGMDTCLPSIVYASGQRYGLVALFTGLFFTMLAPVMIPLAMSLGAN